LLADALREDHGLVFASTVGTPLDHHNVRREFKRITQAARPRSPRGRSAVPDLPDFGVDSPVPRPAAAAPPTALSCVVLARYPARPHRLQNISRKLLLVLISQYRLGAGAGIYRHAGGPPSYRLSPGGNP
jgi:hypothetical protein